MAIETAIIGMHINRTLAMSIARSVVYEKSIVSNNVILINHIRTAVEILMINPVRPCFNNVIMSIALFDLVNLFRMNASKEQMTTNAAV